MNYKGIKSYCNGSTIRTIVVYHWRENEMPRDGKERIFGAARDTTLRGTKLVFGPHYSEYGLQKEDRAEVDGDLLSIFDGTGKKVIAYKKIPG